jgi:hypothetical protein
VIDRVGVGADELAYCKFLLCCLHRRNAFGKRTNFTAAACEVISKLMRLISKSYPASRDWSLSVSGCIVNSVGTHR